MFPGFERTDEASAKESAALQRAERDERPNPSLSAIKSLMAAQIDRVSLCKIYHKRIF